MIVLNGKLEEIILKLNQMETGNDLIRLRIDRIDNRLNIAIRNQHMELTKLRAIEASLTNTAPR